jgi:hypothetical protein
LKDGVKMAAQAIDSGVARWVLQQLVTISNEPDPEPEPEDDETRDDDD